MVLASEGTSYPPAGDLWPKVPGWNISSCSRFSSIGRTIPGRAGITQSDQGSTPMGKGILLWLIGIPIPIILLLWIFGFLH
jgi:hypothetical protein